MEMKAIDKITYTLLVIGGLNWGLVGAFHYNLVSKIFGIDSTLTRIIYSLVGLAGVYGVYSILAMMSSMNKTDAK